MDDIDFNPPSDEVIEAAQKTLGVTFSAEYIDFIKSGYDLGNSTLDPLEIDEPESYVDMFVYCKEAWEAYGVPRDLLPIIHDNADFYCLTMNWRGPTRPIHKTPC